MGDDAASDPTIIRDELNGDYVTDTEKARRRALGMDPAVDRYRPSEEQTAVRIEKQRGVTLTRHTESNSAPDWVGSDGLSYDAMGNFPAKYFDDQWTHFKNELHKHVRKADYVPIDVSQFTPSQIRLVEQEIKPYGSKVFLVGT
ncbi:MAG: hypothetical protein GEV10_25585 [Streptosporangiales bacterium]|nr:hypothetical protein [Streptosporangiales bacterium]